MNTTNKVIVIGAHGQIGQHLVQKLADSERCQPVAFVRDAAQKTDFSGTGADVIVGNLEDSVDSLSAQFDGAQAIVFAAGSGADSGAEQTLTVDLEGAARSIEAAENAGVGRFVMISAAGADDRTFWDDAGIKPYYIAKHHADRVLRESKLDYTIVRPVRLNNEAGTDHVAIAENNDVPGEEIPREDVAGVIAQLLTQPVNPRTTITISSGKAAIENALGDIRS
jgi:uncharacterized protein YbjT (DUF2867 family)